MSNDKKETAVHPSLYPSRGNDYCDMVVHGPYPQTDILQFAQLRGKRAAHAEKRQAD